MARYEPEPKPELQDLKTIAPDTSEFSDPDRAQALIQHLELKVGDSIREDGDERFTINPRMVLRGSPPEHYTKMVDCLKKLLTKRDIKAIDAAVGKNTKDYNSKLYDRLKKKFDSFYGENNEPKANLPKQILEGLEGFKGELHGPYNTLYHVLSKGSDDFLVCYKAAWKSEPIPNIQTWYEEDDGEYVVLTDSEADQRAEDYLDEDMWKCAVQAGNTTQGFEEWAEDVISMDGRGSLLSSYDGSEEEETVNGTTYYIYRTN